MTNDDILDHMSPELLRLYKKVNESPPPRETRAAPHDRQAAEESDGDPEPSHYEHPTEERREDQRGDAWKAPDKSKPTTPADESYRFVTIDSKTFFSTNYSMEWLVQRLLVAKQPCVLGGPKKTLKTSTLIDLAVSLSTATPFLGRFDVYRKHRVVIISGESGEAVLQECGRRVCAGRGIDPEELDIEWSFRLPQVANPLDRKRLCAGLKALGASVVIIDPLYLCLLAGLDAKDIEAGNLYKMGPLLSTLCRACLDAGCTPILCHHARKGSGQTYEPLDLDDLSFAGIAEFARQWILESRRAPYDSNTGSSKLWVTVGGSAGQSGCWAVDVEEGLINDDFSGRKWEVTVRSMHDARFEQAIQGEEKKDATKAAILEKDSKKVLQAIDDLTAKDSDPPPTKNKIRERAALSGERTTRAIALLLEQEVIQEQEAAWRSGKGGSSVTTTKGYRRWIPKRDD